MVKKHPMISYWLKINTATMAIGEVANNAEYKNGFLFGLFSDNSSVHLFKRKMVPAKNSAINNLDQTSSTVFRNIGPLLRLEVRPR